MPDNISRRSILLFPGIASNRFLHPVHFGLRGIVEDVVELAAEEYNIIFPEIHMPEKFSGHDPIDGLTVDEQSARARDVLLHVSKRVELDEVVYIAQSLGGLAVAQLVQNMSEVTLQRVILLGPPTIGGDMFGEDEHRKMVAEKFSVRERTDVDDNGNGVLEFGKGRLMRVTSEFWRSMADNSIRVHHEHMLASTARADAICASEDDYYPDNAEFISSYAPGITRYEVSGKSHTFRDSTMRTKVKSLVQKMLGVTNSE